MSRMRVPELTMLIKEHPYIVIWGKESGSFGSYIHDQLLLAWKEEAPENVIYKYIEDDGTEVWRTIEDCTEEGRPGFIATFTAKAMKLKEAVA